MKFLSVSDILALNLPYLPSSKPALLAKAKKERWEEYESRGLGGVRKLYVVPEHYLQGGATPVTQKIALHAAQQAAHQAYQMAQIVGNVDAEKFVEMFTTLCKTEPTEQPSMSHNARHKVKAGANSNVITGDGNFQIVKGKSNDK